MSPELVGLIALIILFVLIAFGMSIGVSMALMGVLGFWYLMSGSAAEGQMSIVPFSTIYSYDFLVIPLFMFMAHIIFVTGLGKDLYTLAAKWLGNLPGGLAMATVGACAGFSAICASSSATGATMGLIAIPEMKKYKYDPALSTGCVAAGGTMGVLIPPALGLIVYGIITEESIGRLFIAGIVPGILEAVFYIITIYVLCKWKPNYGPPGPRYSFREKILAFSGCAEVVALVILLLGGLTMGWFTPTEAGSVGAFGAIIFSLIRRRLTWSKFWEASMNTMKTTGMIFFILIGAYIFKPFMAVTNIPFWLADSVTGLPLPPLLIVAAMMLVWLVLGCFVDVMAMILLTVPIFHPLVITMGFDSIWFGILMVRLSEIALITPPIGMNVYVISGVAPDVPMETIFKGIVPFLIADIFHVTLLLFVPAVTLFLPNLIM